MITSTFKIKKALGDTLHNFIMKILKNLVISTISQNSKSDG